MSTSVYEHCAEGLEFLRALGYLQKHYITLKVNMHVVFGAYIDGTIIRNLRIDTREVRYLLQSMASSLIHLRNFNCVFVESTVSLVRQNRGVHVQS